MATQVATYNVLEYTDTQIILQIFANNSYYYHGYARPEPADGTYLYSDSWTYIASGGSALVIISDLQPNTSYAVNVGYNTEPNHYTRMGWLEAQYVTTKPSSGGGNTGSTPYNWTYYGGAWHQSIPWAYYNGAWFKTKPWAYSAGWREPPTM